MEDHRLGNGRETWHGRRHSTERGSVEAQELEARTSEVAWQVGSGDKTICHHLVKEVVEYHSDLGVTEMKEGKQLW